MLIGIYGCHILYIMQYLCHILLISYHFFLNLLGGCARSGKPVGICVALASVVLDLEVEVCQSVQPSVHDSGRAIHVLDELQGDVVRAPKELWPILLVVPVLCHPVHSGK